MKVVVYETVPEEISNSLNYTRIKHELHSHINNFCREKVDLKNKLHVLRLAVGRRYDPEDVKNTLEQFKEEFNEKDNNIGLDYNIVVTKFDFVVTVHVVIKRTDIEMKKFVFRYRKKSTTENEDLSIKPKESKTNNNENDKTINESLIPKKYKKTTKELKTRYLNVGYSIAKRYTEKEKEGDR